MSTSPRSGARGSKDSHLCKIIVYKNGKVDSVWDSTLPKIRIASKKALNNSCLKLNSEQKRCDAYFWQCRAPNWIYVPVFVYIIIFQIRESFKPPSSTLEGDRHMRSRIFCTKFNFKQLLFKGFLVPCVFLAVSSLKLHLFSHFCTLLFHKNEKSPLAPFQRGRGERLTYALTDFFVRNGTTFI